MKAIFKREFSSYFTGPVGYVFMATFLAISGLFFYLFMIGIDNYSIGTYSMFLLIVFTILIPILTMRTLSEERKTKSEQLLLTAPVSLSDIVIGKFSAALLLYTITLLLSAVNFIFLYIYAQPNTAVLITNFVGVFFVGAAFVAIGVFISALTESQVIAAVGTVGAILLLLVLHLISSYIDTYFIAYIVKWISPFSRYVDFSEGIFNISSIVYYISIVGMFLFFTVRVLEKRRWS